MLLSRFKLLMLAFAMTVIALPATGLAGGSLSISNVRPSGPAGPSIGTMMVIQWDSSGISPLPAAGSQQKLKIWLKQNGYASCTIADNVSAQLKSHSWQVGNCLGGKAAPGSGYQLVVELKGTQVKGESLQPFQIQQTPRYISIIPGGVVNASGVQPAQGSLPTAQAGPTVVVIKPMIQSVSPSNVLPGTKVTVNGTFFSPTAGAKQLKMIDQAGNAFRLNVLRWTDTLLYAEVPPGTGLNRDAVITYDVGLWDNSGKLSNTVPIAVQVPCTIAVTPTKGPGGTQVSLVGDHFGNERFKELLLKRGMQKYPVKMISWSNQQIIAELPEGITSGIYQFSVANSSGLQLCGGATFEVNAPLIRSVGPNSGPFPKDAKFAITGMGFGPATNGREVRISSNGPVKTYIWLDDGIMVQLERPLTKGTHRVSIYEAGRRISNEVPITVTGPVPRKQ